MKPMITEVITALGDVIRTIYHRSFIRQRYKGIDRFLMFDERVVCTVCVNREEE